MFLFHYPFSNSNSYNRIKFHNFKDTFSSLNIEFGFFNDKSDLNKILNSKEVKLIYTSFHRHYLNKIDFDLIKSLNNETKILMDLPIWENPLSEANYTDVKELKNNRLFKYLLDKNLINYLTCYLDKSDLRMQNFQRDTNMDYFFFSHCANTLSLYNQFDHTYKCDCSFLGSNLPKKRTIFKQIFPFLKSKDFRLHGQGWTNKDRFLTFFQKFGEYKNINFLKNIAIKKIDLNDEKKIYSSSKINLNIHNDYEHYYGGPINERFFSIAACKGFQISDKIDQISNNFKEGHDVVTWENTDDFIDKYEFYLKNYDLALNIAENQYKKIIENYTYDIVIKNLLKYCEYK